METLILNSIKESTFLVTGGAGFIGSNLCEFLVSNKAKKVICFDNLFSGKLENIKELMNENNFSFIKGDIRDFELLLNVTKGIDYILHQAAWGSVPRSMVQPLNYTSNNVQGTHNVFEAARINKIKKVIYASSSSVYGDYPSLPKVEGKEGNLISPYALSKKINEEYGKLYWEVYKLPTIGLRYFNVFGKRQNADGDYAAVIPKFIQLMINNQPLTVFGDGKQSRDFTFIDNVIQANIHSVFLTNAEAFGKAFNIALQESASILDLFQLLKSNLNSSSELVYKEARDGDIKHSLADINLAKNILSYSPSHTFKEGISLYINWFLNNKKI